jgi:uncharacterized integral membrane protein (TIGR00698 family)
MGVDPVVAPPTSAFRRLLVILPGLLLLVGIGLLGKITEKSIAAYSKSHHLVIPNIEYVLWAILFGMIVSNTVGVSKRFEPGVATYEFWLKLGIVLLGSRFLLVDVLKLGGVSLVLVALELMLSIALMTWLGRAFGLKPKLTSLLAIGSSICGVSAIIAAKGAIDADDEDSSLAITVILSLGALALFTFPVIGHLLGMTDTAFGLWAGLGVDNTAEAVATGSLYSEAAGKVAVLAKTTRNATIGFVVLGYAFYWARKGMAKEIANKGLFLWEKFPKFILGFIVLSLCASAGLFSKPQLTSLGNLSKWCFLLTFAGVGLRTDFAAMKTQGFRPFVVGALGEVAIAVLTLALVYSADRLFGL